MKLHTLTLLIFLLFVYNSCQCEKKKPAKFVLINLINCDSNDVLTKFYLPKDLDSFVLSIRKNKAIKNIEIKTIELNKNWFNFSQQNLLDTIANTLKFMQLKNYEYTVFTSLIGHLGIEGVDENISYGLQCNNSSLIITSKQIRGALQNIKYKKLFILEHFCRGSIKKSDTTFYKNLYNLIIKDNPLFADDIKAYLNENLQSQNFNIGKDSVFLTPKVRKFVDSLITKYLIKTQLNKEESDEVSSEKIHIIEAKKSENNTSTSNINTNNVMVFLPTNYIGENADYRFGVFQAIEQILKIGKNPSIKCFVNDLNKRINKLNTTKFPPYNYNLLIFNNEQINNNSLLDKYIIE